MSQILLMSMRWRARTNSEKRDDDIVSYWPCSFGVSSSWVSMNGSTGPLLPVYQDFYHLTFLIVSMIFISNCLGCLTSAVLNVWISRRVAFSKILVLAVVFQIIAYSILSGAPPFALMCIGFYINGMGMSLLNSQCNSLLSMLHNPTAMGLAHASYGVGALVAPLLSTQFADYYTRTHARNWSLYYAILIGASLSNFVSFVTILRGAGYEEVLKGMGVSQQEEIELRNNMSRTESGNDSTVDVAQTETGDSAFTRSTKEGNTFGIVLKQVHVHVLAAFVFIYVGVEVTIGGWIVTFMINERGGGPSSGYVSSGFFGGLALGRVALLKITQLLGDRNAIFLYVALGVILEITIWFVPSLIGNAIAVSLVGMMIGPFYPIVMNQTGRIIPRKVLSGSIGWIAGFGQSGSAVLPFLTGALANKYGIVALQPLIVAMMASMAALWFMVPTIAKRRE
ncbi:MFS general substrate transporter [Serendipita vermifera]|nr:MFS general substrate transporter [Serendipita vermifera]